jgi:1-acyl-sn-glycerol-3-phosphate acyltransferase
MPLQREFLRALGGVPVDRQNPRATLSSFRQLLPLLQQKAYIVLFPEGTYVRGGVGPGKHRLVQMILKLQGKNGLGQISFVPLGIRYEPRPHSSTWGVTVRVGPPLPRQRKNAIAILLNLMPSRKGDGTNKKLLGGKGAGLCTMTQIGLPVPPGFVYHHRSQH